jgi:predicted DNA-binding protein (MmcQ/YjbR family)
VTDWLETLRAFCLDFPGAFEDHPFGPDPVFKAANRKIFAFCGSGKHSGLSFSVKLTPEEAAEALILPFVSVAPYVGRHGWISVRLDSELEWDIAREWVRRSFELVTSKPARKSAAVARKRSSR